MIRRRVHAPQLSAFAGVLNLFQGYAPAYNLFLAELTNPEAPLRASFISPR